jgi:phosphatidylglycerol:prolipoprotein diacylglycerol transferase
MLTISDNPVAFTIGSLEVRWYGIMVAIAVAALLVIMLREAKRRGVERYVYSIFFWGIIGGVVGGRITYVIYYWPEFAADPRAIFGLAGSAQTGAIIGVIVAALIYAGVKRMRFSTLLTIGDAFVVGGALALAISRIGCTLNGCCYGQPSPFNFFPMAVVYSPRDTIPSQFWGVPLYPTQIYHVLWNLIVLAIVWRFRKTFESPGMLLFFGLCIFAPGDLALRFLRGVRGTTNGAIVFWGLDNPQVVDFAIFVIFLPWLVFKLRRSRRQAPAPELATEPEPEQSRGG